jgi:uncharacterized membrane protein YfcA
VGPVSALQVVLLALAGLAAGLAGSMAGLASLISYPALLAVGLAPVQANVTNTVALVFSGVGAALGSRPELRGEGPRVRRLALPAVLGGIVGGVLLLTTPPGAFELIVPWLIGLASLAILLRPPPGQLGRPPHHHVGSAKLFAGVFLIGIYGGYFGAAAGVILLALLLASTGETLARNNALKNAILALANGVAALGFALFGPVHWVAVIPLSLGFLAGGRLGPAVVRRSPAGVLRGVIAVAGLAVALRLGFQAYG